MPDSEPIRLSTSVFASGDRASVFAARVHRTESGVVFAGGPGRVVKVTQRGSRASSLAELTAAEAARLARVLSARPASLRMLGTGDYEIVTGFDRAGRIVDRVLVDPVGAFVVRWTDGDIVLESDFPDTAGECVGLIAARGFALDAESTAVLRGMIA